MEKLFEGRIQNSIKESGGFTIIELVIAIFILTVAIIGVYNAFSTVVVLTAGAGSRLTAAYLAQEGIEIVRNMRDNNWLAGEEDWRNGLLVCEYGCEADYKTGTSSMYPGSGLTGFSGSGRDLKINDDNRFYSYDETGEYTAIKFKRKITITPVSEDVLQVSVLVIWQEKEEVFDIEAEEYLYNWY